VLIHGYLAPPEYILSYFKGLVEYLRRDCGYNLPIVIFDWKSEARHWEELSPAEREAFNGPSYPTLGTQAAGRSSHWAELWGSYLGWEQNQYSTDKDVAGTEGADALRALLKSIHRTNSAAKIRLIAHSMGSLVVFRALRHPSDFSSVQQIVL